jgi:hypothetical protein
MIALVFGSKSAHKKQSLVSKNFGQLIGYYAMVGGDIRFECICCSTVMLLAAEGFTRVAFSTVEEVKEDRR